VVELLGSVGEPVALERSSSGARKPTPVAKSRALFENGNRPSNAAIVGRRIATGRSAPADPQKEFLSSRKVAVIEGNHSVRLMAQIAPGGPRCGDNNFLARIRDHFQQETAA
jgi:hypothetical protein